MELSCATWDAICASLPRNGHRGRPWRDHRQVIAAILWKLETGKPWRRLPAHFGPWQTAYDRYTRWRKDGTWQQIEALLQHHGLGGVERRDKASTASRRPANSLRREPALGRSA